MRWAAAMYWLSTPKEGLDEISLASPTFVAELKDGHVSEYELEPGLFGLPQVAASELVVNGKDEAVEMLLAALENRHAGAAAIVALNAGAAIYVAGRAASLMDGVAQAQHCHFQPGRARRARTLPPLQPIIRSQSSMSDILEKILATKRDRNRRRPGCRAPGRDAGACRSSCAVTRFRRRLARQTRGRASRQ